MATSYSITDNPRHPDDVDAPVPERQYPASPEGAARVDAWLAQLTPEERALLEDANDPLLEAALDRADASIARGELGRLLEDVLEELRATRRDEALSGAR